MPVSRVVTLAALYGTGGSVIGPKVAERLGVPFLPRAISRSVADDGLSQVAVPGEDDESRSRWNRVFEALGRASPPTGASGQEERLDLEGRSLHADFERFLGEASSTNGLVVLGRGAAVVLASVPGALHVYLVGDLDRRIERMMDLHHLDRTAAAHRVDAHDRARQDYVKTAYGIDGNDPSLYHLMIDAISLGMDTCIDLIVTASLARTRSRLGSRDVGRKSAQAS